jgi:hypothetical protein
MLTVSAACGRQDTLPATACWPSLSLAQQVRRGDVVRISSAGFRCGYLPHGGKTATYRVVGIHGSQGGKPIESELARVVADSAGAFDSTFEVSSNLPLGVITVYVRGSRVDRCRDSGDCLLVFAVFEVRD